MIAIKSNIDSVIRSFTGKSARIACKINQTLRLMVDRICSDLDYEIEMSRFNWEEPNTNLGEVGVPDYDVIPLKNGFRVEIGNNLEPIIMSDEAETEVNPMYFIEFGYGIIGQDFSHPNADEYNWVYNLKGHKDAWFFKGLNGHTMKSKGNDGSFVIYDTLEEYRKNWSKYFLEIIKENNL